MGIITYCCYYWRWEGSSHSAATTSMLKVYALEQILALIHVHANTLHAIWTGSIEQTLESCATQAVHSLPSGLYILLFVCFTSLSLCHLLFWYPAFVMVSLSLSCVCFDYFVWMQSFADCVIHFVVDIHIRLYALRLFCLLCIFGLRPTNNFLLTFF